MTKKFFAVCLVAATAFFQVQANPLVISQVMSSEASSSYPDWWQLSNYGTNDIDLSGYSWNDDSHGGFAGAVTGFDGVIIHGHESVIFTETAAAVNSAADFRTWWGLPGTVQVFIIGGPGLGAGGDTVRLWNTNRVAMGAATNGIDPELAPQLLVDRVDLGADAKGHTLYYNTNTGKFDVQSSLSDGISFQVATGDIGAPGLAFTNPAPIAIVTQPTNILANVGTPATFTIQAIGVPKPNFQWLFNGVPVDTNYCTASFNITNNFMRGTLTIPNVQVTNGGTFRVVVTNGFQSAVISSNAVLTVNTAPLAPVFTQVPLTNMYAYAPQTATFTVAAFASPPPNFQWQSNGVNIAGANDATFTLHINDTNETAIYSVQAYNVAGTNTASVNVVITEKPNLRITEIMSTENPGGGHNDWWEFSNLGTFPVNIQGFRFDDNSAFSGIVPFSQSYTIPDNVTISPGESIVLCEDMTPDQFRTWWGADQLPPNLQIVMYHAAGLSFSGSAGDALTVWNGAATDENDYIDSVTISIETNAVSFGFDPVSQTFLGIKPDGLTVLGVNGGIAAEVNGDIGSPGTIVNLPKITSFALTDGGAQLSWVSQPNYLYNVVCKTNLMDPSWTTVTNTTATDNIWSVTVPNTGPQLFYRVILNR